MKSVGSFLFLVTVMAISCGKKKHDLPISEKDLVYMMVDVHVAEAAIQDLYGATRDSMGQVYYQQIWDTYDINNELLILFVIK